MITKKDIKWIVAMADEEDFRCNFPGQKAIDYIFKEFHKRKAAEVEKADFVKHSPVSKDLAELIAGYGWVPIKSNNPYMVSFRSEASDERLNYYFTTGTATFDRKDGKCETYRNASLEEIETALIKAQ